MTISAATILARAKETLDPAVRTALARLDPATRLVADYHLGFRDASGQPVADRAGKNVRGALALLSARAAGGDADRGVPAAVAVELMHNFSLLHDDIIDGDDTRRHRGTAWAVYGTSAAILTGDALVALASEILAEAPAPGSAIADAVHTLSAATRRMIAGQCSDIAFEEEDSVTLADVQQMVGNKTGALIACATTLGAILAEADPGLATMLEEYGRRVGMAFQLIDDLLGIWGTPEVTGKPAASDLGSRKKSLPVVAALQAGGPDADRLRAIYAQPGELTIEDRAAAAAAVEAAGGRAWAQAEADRETAAALAIVAELPADDEVRDELRVLTDMLCHRDH